MRLSCLTRRGFSILSCLVCGAMQSKFRLDKLQARRSFDLAADTYDEAAVLQREVGNRLVGRLDYIRLNPCRVLDLGAGTGHVAELLLERYRKADVWAADFAPAMLQKVRGRGRWLRRPRTVCADAGGLPWRPLHTTWPYRVIPTRPLRLSIPPSIR